MLSAEIRKKFLQYFEKKGHQILPSAPVVPFSDPTLLFINAGMNPLKEVFLGKKSVGYTRAASSQKCLRVGGKHNDLEQVGHTTRHLTFFEMLGNFSFGDYFKQEAIAFAWELTQEVLQLPAEKIWISVYEKDEESWELWKKWVPENRIVRLEEKDNFWSMGETGPCGPCSELLYDKGSKYGTACSPVEDREGERFFEFWNLVFMEYEKLASGEFVPLPKKNIDTGMGLERIVSLKMGVETVFQTDILAALVQAVEKLSHKKATPSSQSAFFVIADHIRSLAFAIADGVIPSNIERGYILRKLLRRAVRYGRSLDLKEPFLAKLVPVLIQLMGNDYPELVKNAGKMEEILTQEEEAFIRTLQRGGNLLQNILETSQGILKGEDVFRLKDTYGLPLEEILLIAQDHHLDIDQVRFQQLEEEARQRSKASHITHAQNYVSSLKVENLPETTFIGYEAYEVSTSIAGIFHKEKQVSKISAGEKAILFLEKTPFYAEKGGQVGDIGFILGKQGKFQVTDTQEFSGNWIGHIGTLLEGTLQEKEGVFAHIEEKRRKKIQNNHTATHLLHWALQKVLGEHVAQAGSLVEETRLRFDFSHHKALTDKEIERIERFVQEKICENLPVNTYFLSYEEAQKRKDIMQFFGEKYGSTVRVVDVSFCKELCGGTHTTSTGTIGTFKIIKEGSVGAGTRRMEALTALEALHFVQEQEALFRKICHKVGAPSLSQIEAKTEDMLQENATLQQEKKEYLATLRNQLLSSLLRKAQKNKEFTLLCEEVEIPPSELIPLCEEICRSLSPSVVILGAKQKDSCLILIRISPSLPHLDAKELIQKIAPLIQGGGGGKKTFAQAGGKNPNNLSSALTQLRKEIEQLPISK